MTSNQGVAARSMGLTAGRIMRKLHGPSGMTVTSSYGIQFLNIATGTLLARGLSPADRGVLAAAVMWPPVIQALMSLGLPDVINVYMSKKGFPRERVLGAAIGAASCMAILTAVIGWTLGPTLVPTCPRSLVQLYALYPLVAFGTMVACQSLLGAERIAQYNALRLALQLITLTMLVILYAIDLLSPWSAVYVYLAAEVLVAICAWRMLHMKPSFAQFLELLRPMAFFGTATHVSFISIMLAERGQLLVLGAFRNPTELGLFVVALAFVSPISVVGASLAPILMGRAARSQAVEGTRALVLMAMRTGILSIAVAAILIPVIGPATNFLLGGEYSSMVPLAMALCVVAPLQGVNRILTAGLQAQGIPLRVGAAQFSGAVLGMSLLVPAISYLGLTGAAAAIGVGSTVTFVGMAIFTWRLHLARRTGQLKIEDDGAYLHQ